MKDLTKRETNYLLKKCGRPADFCFEWINDASVVSDFVRIVAYAKLVEKELKKYRKTHLSPKVSTLYKKHMKIRKSLKTQ